MSTIYGSNLIVTADLDSGEEEREEECPQYLVVPRRLFVTALQ